MLKIHQIVFLVDNCVEKRSEEKKREKKWDTTGKKCSGLRGYLLLLTDYFITVPLSADFDVCSNVLAVLAPILLSSFVSFFLC